MKISVSLLTLSCLYSTMCFSQTKISPIALPAEEGKEQINGIAFKDYAGFEKKYKLVTVRYRTDSGEQRFVFANKIALKALENGSTNYPDGAVFTKIAVATKEDPAFLSSKVPEGSRRIQIMVRDQKKYKDTGGWGYALFSPRGRSFSPDFTSDAKACYACHRIIPERGQVFSQSFTLSTEWPPKKLSWKKAAGPKFAFSTISVSELPPNIQKLLAPSTKQVSLMGGPLRENVFQGTLDEIRPELINEAIRSNRPALFLSLDKKNFSLTGAVDTLTGSNVHSCPSNEKAFGAYWTTTAVNPKDQSGLGNIVFCAKADSF
ncbi:MAG: cytochrome P460 family protein [Bdellovibrio sp.]